jgi:peptidoglycan/LPS O-acetylase OafA/YrhL
MTNPVRVRYESLGAFRGIAALLLAVFHFPAIFFGAESPLIRHASAFTDLFFALSGFLLMASYGHRLNTLRECGSFLKARLLRLYPLHLVMTGVVLAVPVVTYVTKLVLTWALTGQYAGDFSYPAEPWSNIIGDLFMLQGFGLYDMLHLNFPSWTIGTVFFCSVIFALTTYLKHGRTFVFGVIVAGGMYILATKAPNHMNSTFDFGFVRCALNFFAGALAWSLWSRVPTTDTLKRWAVVGQTVALCSFVGFMTLTTPMTMATLFSPVASVVFLIAFSVDSSDYAEALKHPCFQWLSERSYSMFMTQASLLFIGHQTAEWLGYFEASAPVSQAVGLLSLAVYVALLLVVSNWTHRNIEMRFVAKKKSPAAQPV